MNMVNTMHFQDQQTFLLTQAGQEWEACSLCISFKHLLQQPQQRLCQVPSQSVQICKLIWSSLSRTRWLSVFQLTGFGESTAG